MKWKVVIIWTLWLLLNNWSNENQHAGLQDVHEQAGTERFAKGERNWKHLPPQTKHNELNTNSSEDSPKTERTGARHNMSAVRAHILLTHNFTVPYNYHVPPRGVHYRSRIRGRDTCT